MEIDHRILSNFYELISGARYEIDDPEGKCILCA
jgi:hypothetical protein